MNERERACRRASTLFVERDLRGAALDFSSSGGGKACCRPKRRWLSRSWYQETKSMVCLARQSLSAVMDSVGGVVGNKGSSL